MADRPDEPPSAATLRFQLFRAQGALDFAEHDVMRVDDLSPAAAAGLTAFAAPSAASGQEVRLLFSTPGLSLTHVWLKSGYPLPLHSHDADCLYYIVAGSVRVGTEELGAGDGFFVGAGVPYSYTPGDAGAEVLEFRTADKFGIRFLGGEASWARTLARLAERQPHWPGEQPPGRSSP